MGVLFHSSWEKLLTSLSTLLPTLLPTVLPTLLPNILLNFSSALSYNFLPTVLSTVLPKSLLLCIDCIDLFSDYISDCIANEIGDSFHHLLVMHRFIVIMSTKDSQFSTSPVLVSYKSVSRV